MPAILDSPDIQTQTHKERSFSDKRFLYNLVGIYRNSFPVNPGLDVTGDDLIDIDLHEGDYIAEISFMDNTCIVNGINDRRLGKAIKVNQRFDLLLKSFEGENVQIPLEDIDKLTSIFLSLSVLSFDDAIIEVSPLNSLVVKLKFSSNTILIINTSLQSISENPIAAFSILEEKEVIVSNYNKIENIIRGMNSYLAE